MIFNHVLYQLELCSQGPDGGIRTPDPLFPKQVRYQTALHLDIVLTGFEPVSSL